MHLQDNPAFIISSSPSPFYLVLGCSVILALISKLDMDLTLVGCFSSQNSAHNTEGLKTFSDQEKEDINQNTLRM